ncbi:MAG: AAA family ATPase [Thioclava marina]|uniref:AAA family ATPase n=1 Tax=Thioclava marina TaxID=1915077 RepID=UPI001997C5FD|nr:AAA family ATPase [Thioclava marina]MBC7145084.1 AAA family ATPase [Thioclava marina]
MSDHFPICDLRFDLETSPAKIEAHLTRFLRKLRWVAQGHDPADFDAVRDDECWDDAMRACRPSLHDGDRIRRRASVLADRQLSASGMAHLGREARETLAGLKHGVRMERLASEHHADEIAAALHEEMPWMARATEIAWHAMRESVREGAPAVRLPPLLLDGPPGMGKSHWARRLAELIGTPSELIDAANEPAGFAVAGSQKGWSTAHPGRPVELILRERVGNPVIVIDEVDKVGDVRSNKGFSFALSNALLPLLEPLSARTWSCPYYRVRFDMRWISWVLTSNDRRAVPAPLLSRCRVLDIPLLSGAYPAHFARREGTARGLPADTVEALADMLRGAGHGWDLRAMIKLIDASCARETLPVLH